MPYITDELVAPLIVADRLHAADLRRLRAALPKPPGVASLLAAAIGRVLVAAGARLEAFADRPRTGRGWLLGPELCPECGK